jgi:hypothetical protein
MHFFLNTVEYLEQYLWQTCPKLGGPVLVNGYPIASLPAFAKLHDNMGKIHKQEIILGHKVLEMTSLEQFYDYNTKVVPLAEGILTVEEMNEVVNNIISAC